MEVVQYNQLTVKALRAKVNERGIHVKSRPKKADYIAALRADDRQGTQCPTPDSSPPVSRSSSRRSSTSWSSRSSTKRSSVCPAFTTLIAIGIVIALIVVGVKYLNQNRIPALRNLHEYEFVPHQSVVNEEISTAIFNWNSRADEPDGALAVHLAGGDMIQLRDIAKRIHYVVNTLSDSPGRGKYKLVNLNEDFRSCQVAKNKRQCLEQQMATYLKSHDGCVVFALDASGIDFEESLTFLTAFTDDTAGYIPHPSGGLMKVNKSALVLLSNFGADKFPKLTTTDGAEQEKLSEKSFSENKKLITRHTKGNWSDRFAHRLESQVPVLSSKSGVAPISSEASDL